MLHQNPLYSYDVPVPKQYVSRSGSNQSSSMRKRVKIASHCLPHHIHMILQKESNEKTAYKSEISSMYH